MDYDLIVVKTLERVYKNYYYIIRGTNHSLETKSVRDNLDILKDVMEKTSRYMEESKYERY